VTPPSTPEPDPVDPFDPANLRLDHSHLELPAARKLLTKVPVRRPDSQNFIRVHPHADYRLPLVGLIELKEERETFVVSPSFVGELSSTEFVYATLYLVINRQKVISIWPVKQPRADQRANDWHASAAQAAQEAMQSWIRVVPNQSLGAYETVKANGILPAPEWPELGFAEILRVAFRDRLVDGHNHPVIRHLRGMD
jgi:hypothetical protein